MLNAIDPNLPVLIESLSDDQLRAVALAVCRHALERTGIENDIVVREGMHALGVGVYGDEQLTARVWGLVQTLDERAWRLLNHIDSGYATRQQYEAAFAPARAANAVHAALDLNARTAAVNALEEAFAAVGAQAAADSPPIEDPTTLSAQDIASLRFPLQAAILSIVNEAAALRE